MIKKFKCFNQLCCCLAKYDEDNNILTYKLLPWLENCSVTNYKADSNGSNTKNFRVAVSLVSLERQISCTSEDMAESIINEKMSSFYTKQATFLDNIHREHNSDIIFYKGDPIGIIEYYDHSTVVSIYYDNASIIRVLSPNIAYNIGSGNEGNLNGPVVSFHDDKGLSGEASTICSSSFIIDHGNDNYEPVSIKHYVFD